jgi:hypothetical protein
MRLDLEQEQDHENDEQRGAKKTARKHSPKRQQINAWIRYAWGWSRAERVTEI